MLQDGRIDVYSLPVLSITDLMKKANDPNLEIVAPVQGAPVYCDGAAFRKDDVALRDAFDVELAKMKDIGEFATIIEPYGFSAAAAMSTSRAQSSAASKRPAPGRRSPLSGRADPAPMSRRTRPMIMTDWSGYLG